MIFNPVIVNGGGGVATVTDNFASSASRYWLSGGEFKTSSGQETIQADIGSMVVIEGWDHMVESPPRASGDCSIYYNGLLQYASMAFVVVRGDCTIT